MVFTCLHPEIRSGSRLLIQILGIYWHRKVSCTCGRRPTVSENNKFDGKFVRLKLRGNGSECLLFLWLALTNLFHGDNTRAWHERHVKVIRGSNQKPVKYIPGAAHLNRHGLKLREKKIDRGEKQVFSSDMHQLTYILAFYLFGTHEKMVDLSTIFWWPLKAPCLLPLSASAPGALWSAASATTEVSNPRRPPATRWNGLVESKCPLIPEMISSQ